MNDQHTFSQLSGLAARDQFVQWLGVNVERASPGAAEIRMTVREEHMNFNGTCHGGVLFSLADTAFGLASNSHGVIAIGVHADIAFCAPAAVGSTLTAKAVEISRSRRVGTYRVEIAGEDGNVMATFTGTVHRTEKPHQ